MGKKVYRIFLITSWVVVLITSACNLLIEKDFTIPKSEIVYQAINNTTNIDLSNNLIGFVNADGSGGVQIPLKLLRPYRPLVSKEWGGIFFGGGRENPLGISFSDGPLYFLNQNDELQSCNTSDGPFYFPLHGRKYVLVFDDTNVALLDLFTCWKVKTLVSLPTEVPWKIKIFSAMPSDSGDKVIFSEVYSTLPDYRYVIYIVDIDTGTTKEFLEGGFNASLSPDEKKIAYVGDKGIYVANVDGTHQTLLVPMNLDPLIDINPWPFWSTDGTTLVYHKCTNSACYDLSDFSIYQVNVNTGVEKKIIAGGLFPIWIK